MTEDTAAAGGSPTASAPSSSLAPFHISFRSAAEKGLTIVTVLSEAFDPIQTLAQHSPSRLSEQIRAKQRRLNRSLVQRDYWLDRPTGKASIEVA